jgi:hypothetical protein
MTPVYPEFTKLSETYLKFLRDSGVHGVIHSDGEKHPIAELLKSSLFPVQVKQPIRFYKRVN